jgi:hypothetical protein
MVVADQFRLKLLEQLIGLTSENANIGDSQEKGDKEELLGFHNALAMIDSLDERRYENGGTYRA